MRPAWSGGPVRPVPANPWREVRRWQIDSGPWDCLSLRVYVNLRTGAARWWLTSEVALVADGESRHPVEWTIPVGDQEAYVAQFVSRVVGQVQKQRESLGIQGREWVESHPALHEYLTLTEYEPGQPRETAMLLFFVEDGRWKAALQDRQEARSLWVTADTVPAALDALEAILQSGTADWRQMRGQQQSGKRRK